MLQRRTTGDYISHLPDLKENGGFLPVTALFARPCIAGQRERGGWPRPRPRLRPGAGGGTAATAEADWGGYGPRRSGGAGEGPQVHGEEGEVGVLLLVWRQEKEGGGRITVGTETVWDTLLATLRDVPSDGTAGGLREERIGGAGGPGGGKERGAPADHPFLCRFLKVWSSVFWFGCEKKGTFLKTTDLIILGWRFGALCLIMLVIEAAGRLNFGDR